MSTEEAHKKIDKNIRKGHGTKHQNVCRTTTEGSESSNSLAVVFFEASHPFVQ